MVKRIVAELQRRGYIVWFDLERMKGSVMDAVRAPSTSTAASLLWR